MLTRKCSFFLLMFSSAAPLPGFMINLQLQLKNSTLDVIVKWTQAKGDGKQAKQFLPVVAKALYKVIALLLCTCSSPLCMYNPKKPVHYERSINEEKSFDSRWWRSGRISQKRPRSRWKSSCACRRRCGCTTSWPRKRVRIEITGLLFAVEMGPVKILFITLFILNGVGS